MIYKEIPENFNPKFEAVGTFVCCNGEIILLHRQDYKPQGGTWGIPSGKRDDGESPLDTACREILEETGIRIPRDEMKYFSVIYVRNAEYDFIYYFETRI
jgi:8-oxo-dGTP pyrophosphatase MutT (NUDIX family)